MRNRHVRRVSWLVVVVLVSVGLSVMAVGCGKSGSTTSSTQNAAVTTKSARLTQAQTVTAGDAICTTTIKEVEPLLAQLDRALKSGVGKQEINQRRGPILEQIAARVRNTSRSLQELKPIRGVQEKLTQYASSLLELSILEEQLAQAAREEESARIAPVTSEVLSKRTYSQGQAKRFGFRVCGASLQTPVG